MEVYNNNNYAYYIVCADVIYEIDISLDRCLKTDGLRGYFMTLEAIHSNGYEKIKDIPSNVIPYLSPTEIAKIRAEKAALPGFEPGTSA